MASARVVEEFLQQLEEGSHSDTTSMNSEDEMAIESEIIRHDSEEEIDHGPVLASLRAERRKEREDEETKSRLERAERKKAKDKAAVETMLDDAVPFGEDLDTKSIKSEQPKEDKLEIDDAEAEVKSEDPPGVPDVLKEEEPAAEEEKKEAEKNDDEEKKEVKEEETDDAEKTGETVE